MAIERFTVGRKYTKRRRIYISPEGIDTAEGVAALTEWFRQMAKGATLESRIAPAVQWATATLECAGLPLDPGTSIYSDREWLRANERKTRVGYATAILETAQWLRRFRANGEIDLTLNLALDLAVLATEARIIFGCIANNAARGGKARAAERRADIQAQHDEWRRQAAELRSRHPTWSASAIAGRIDPGRVRTIRGIIAKQKPKPPRR